MFLNYYIKVIFSLIILFFCLSYFFVPLYELLCTQFGWGTFDYSDFFIKKKFLNEPELGYYLSSEKLEELKYLLQSNLYYRQNVHFDSTFRSLLIPVSFYTVVHGKLPLFFFINEDLIQVKADSSQLVIFNIFNYGSKNIDFFIGYQIFPYSLTKYIIKLQCFCYEHILILSYSFLKLPVLFYIDSEIFRFDNNYFDNYSCVFFYYHVYKSGKSLEPFLN